MTRTIPRRLYQTYPTREVPPILRANSDRLIELHPGWEYQLFGEDDCQAFVREAYGTAMLDLYLRIDPGYGAARADFFRYLLMYRRGGVYLDIKSSVRDSLDRALSFDEGFVLSKWRNGPGEAFEGSGLLPELAAWPRGEFEQWHVICAPEHPYLAAVIDRVCANIRGYTPWRGGVGRRGVLRLTGPIAYTLAIEPIRHLHPHVEVESHDVLSLDYSCLGAVDHRPFFKTHYTQMDTPIVRPGLLSRVPVGLYVAARRLKHRLFRRGEVL